MTSPILVKAAELQIHKAIKRVDSALYGDPERDSINLLLRNALELLNPEEVQNAAS